MIQGEIDLVEPLLTLQVMHVYPAMAVYSGSSSHLRLMQSKWNRSTGSQQEEAEE